MKPNELFELIKATDYIKSGDDVDWAIYVKDDEQVIYLLFAPSNSKRDWVNNFSFPVKVYKRQESKIKAAMGWRNAWKSCNDLIIQSTAEVVSKHPSYKVIVAGWSYGGAMSLLAAEDFQYRTGIRPSVITFGAPKPFWGRSSIKYLKQVLGEVKEYGHKSDIVTYCPPLPGYKHVNRKSIGKCSLFGLFKPNKWHCIYGEGGWYEAD